MSLFSFDIYTLLLALLGGILPALIWLWFWLKEDSAHPEPKRLIIAAFIAGMIAVPVAFFLEKFAFSFLGTGLTIVIVWAAIEELLKYGGAYIVAFRSVCLDKSMCVDEPLDPLIYMITVALGFSALENTMFLINPLLGGDTVSGFLTGNLRFIGATLLHVVASATIGLGKGLSFYKNNATKRVYFAVGITVAIALHALFNFSIIIYKGQNIFLIFGVLWIFVVALLLSFERVKRLTPGK
ncbi:MAG: PrsW family intramembrane metalloprotease [Parcubacteria group bacterium]|nr:PrsW family intramembrane metalloprotease [Parcubacteria group bacterium]